MPGSWDKTPQVQAFTKRCQKRCKIHLQWCVVTRLYRWCASEMPLAVSKSSRFCSPLKSLLHQPGGSSTPTGLAHRFTRADSSRNSLLLRPPHPLKSDPPLRAEFAQSLKLEQM